MMIDEDGSSQNIRFWVSYRGEGDGFVCDDIVCGLGSARHAKRRMLESARSGRCRVRSVCRYGIESGVGAMIFEISRTL